MQLGSVYRHLRLCVRQYFRRNLIIKSTTAPKRCVEDVKRWLGRFCYDYIHYYINDDLSSFTQNFLYFRITAKITKTNRQTLMTMCKWLHSSWTIHFHRQIKPNRLLKTSGQWSESDLNLSHRYLSTLERRQWVNFWTYKNCLLFIYSLAEPLEANIFSFNNWEL